MSLSFNVLSFGLGLASIFGGSVASSFAGGLAIPLAGLAIGLGGLIQITDSQWERCRLLGEYTIALERSYHNFIKSNQGTELNLSDTYVIVSEVNLKTGKVQLWTPWLPKFYPPSRGTVFSVGTHQKGDSWEVNYKKFTGNDLPLTKRFNGGVEEIILPILPNYKIHIEKLGVGGKYHRYDAEIMALPKLSGGTNVSWGWGGFGYEIGFTNRVGGPLEYWETTVKVIGSNGSDILITPSLEEESGKTNNFIRSIRNLLTYNIEKSNGSCMLVVSKYAKYQITLGKDASLLLNFSAVGNFNLDYQNRKINFGNNWVAINFLEGEQSLTQIIIVDNKGKYQKVNFSTQSLEILWVDSELYHKATNKSIENELMTGKSIDPLIDSTVTIPIKNAAKDYQRSKPSTRCSYGFYFRNKNAIQFLDAPGKLPSSLSIIKCLSDQVILRQQVTIDPRFPGGDFYYYVKKDDGSFKIEFLGKPHSQVLDYLITGKLPSPRKGILKKGCPNCGSGNIDYMLDNQDYIYVDPLRCLDCNFQFTKYRTNEVRNLLISNIEDIHNLLLKWSSDSNEVYSDYINLVIEASESNYNAEQSEVKQKREQLLQQVLQELNSESGKGKRASLKRIFWSLVTDAERNYVTFLLGRAITDLNYPVENPSNISYVEQYNPSDWSSSNQEFIRYWAESEGQDSFTFIYFYFINLIDSAYSTFDPYHTIYTNSILLADTMDLAQQTYQLLINEPGQRKLKKLLEFDQGLTMYGKFRLRYILKRPVANLLPKVYDEHVILTLNQEVNVVDQLLLNQQENLINEILLNQEENIPDDVPLNQPERQEVQNRLLNWALSYSEDNNLQGDFNFIALYINRIFDCYQKPEYLTDQYQLYLDVYAQEVNRKLNDKSEKLEGLIELYQNLKTRQKLFVKDILRSPLANLLAESSSDNTLLNLEENVSLNQEEKRRIYELLREWTGGRHNGYRNIDNYILLIFEADENPQLAEENKEIIEVQSHEITEELKELPGQLEDLKQIYQALNTSEQIFVQQILRNPVSNLLLEVIKLDNESVSLNQEQKTRIYNLLFDWTQREYADYLFMSDYIYQVFEASQNPQLVREYKRVIDGFSQEFSSRLSYEPIKLEQLRQLYGELNTQEQIFARKLLKIPVVKLLIPDNENVSLNQEEKRRIYELLQEWTGGRDNGYRTIDDYIRLVFEADENPQLAEENKEIIEVQSHEITEELKELPGQLEDLKQIYQALNTPEQIFVQQILRNPVSNLLLEVIKLDNESVSLNHELKTRIYNLLIDWTQREYADYLFMSEYNIYQVFEASQNPQLVREYKRVIDGFSQEFSSRLSNEPIKLERLRQLYGELNTQEQIFARKLLKIPVVKLLIPDNENVSLNQAQNVSLNQEEKRRIYELLEGWTEESRYSTIYDYILLVFGADENPQLAEENKEIIEVQSHEITEELKELPGQLEDLTQIYQALNTSEQIFVQQILRNPVSNLLLEVIKLDNESVSLNHEQKTRIYNLLFDWTQREYADYLFMSDYIYEVFKVSQNPQLVRGYKSSIDWLSQEFSLRLSYEPIKLEQLRQLYGELNTQEQIFARKLLKIPVVKLLIPDNENVSLNQEENAPLNLQERRRIYKLLEGWTVEISGNYHFMLYEYIKLIRIAYESPQFTQKNEEKIDTYAQWVSWELITAEDPIKLEQLKQLSLTLKTQEKVFLRKLLKPLISHLLPDPYTEKVELTEEKRTRIYDLLEDWVGEPQSGWLFDYLATVANAFEDNNNDEEYQLYLDSLSFEVSQKLMDEEPEKLQQLKQLSESLEKPEKDFLHELLRPLLASLLN